MQTMQTAAACLSIAHTLSFNVAKDIFRNPKNVRFDDLLALCRDYFGEPRVRGSHYIFKTPWAGDPRINIQRDGKLAKAYQVRQVQRAIEKLEREREQGSG